MQHLHSNSQENEAIALSGKQTLGLQLREGLQTSLGEKIEAMLRNLLIKSSFDSLASNGFNISHNPVCVQSVRWRRKPRWLPVAKSKMFRVPERHQLPAEEVKEWLRLNNNYR